MQLSGRVDRAQKSSAAECDILYNAPNVFVKVL